MKIFQFYDCYDFICVAIEMNKKNLLILQNPMLSVIGDNLALIAVVLVKMFKNSLFQLKLLHQNNPLVEIYSLTRVEWNKSVAYKVFQQTWVW